MDLYEYCMIRTQEGRVGVAGGAAVDGVISDRLTYCGGGGGLWGSSLHKGPDIISLQTSFYSSLDSHSSTHLTDTTRAGVDVK